MIRLLFLLLISILSANLALSQTNPYTTYAELLGFQKGLFSNKLIVTVDFGQRTSFWKKINESKIVDETGKDIVFNSMVDAMNYMGKRGWKFVQAYVVTEGDQNVYHWLLSKEVCDSAQITEGFHLKADFSNAPKTCYTITYMKRPATSKEWDIVKTERKCDASQEEVTAIVTEWRNKTTEHYVYDCQIKKE